MCLYQFTKLQMTFDKSIHLTKDSWTLKTNKFGVIVMQQCIHFSFGNLRGTFNKASWEIRSISW